MVCRASTNPGAIQPDAIEGHYRRDFRAICWFRETAVQHIAQMHRLKDVLDRHGYPVAIIREQRVGYIVYEDEDQVVAEPFKDTRTRGG
jgi:hypothetical protein